MLELQDLIGSLPPRPAGATLIESFVPPPRFAGKRFDNYRPDPAFPSQSEALARLRALASELSGQARGGWLERLRSALGPARPGGGVYLDGGFGVGKTHLLAALWHAVPGPKAYLSFDELVYTIGLLGVEQTGAAFREQRLVAIDEWELDDPGNLKLALAFLRDAVASGVQLAVTSNTLPLELGEGRFSQKDFQKEIEELAGAFRVIRIAGEDFRHRHFEAEPGREYFQDPGSLRRAAGAAGERTLLVPFGDLLAGLERVHPIRYATLVERTEALFVEGIDVIERLPDALRWVHFVDVLYDGAVPFAASGPIALGELFPPSFISGSYGKKMSRCLSRMEEMLGEGTEAAPRVQAGG